MSASINKSAKTLVLIISALVLVTLLVAHFVYESINQSVDPRVVTPRMLYEGYNGLAQRNAFDSVFLLMDELENKYNRYPHYRNSYEVGVLFNNRAAAYLTMALYFDTNHRSVSMRDSLVILSENAAQKSIDIYKDWLTKYQDKTKDEIANIASVNFFVGLENEDEKQKDRYFNRRIKEIITAQEETLRRLSVSYSNLGIVYRHQQQYEKAAKYYKMAFDLWGENLVAENNLNMLFNKPLRKRTFTQKMFPPKK